MSDAAVRPQNVGYYVNFAVGFVIMCAGWFIPEGILPDLTPIGLQVMGVFVGTIYLWATTDPLAASIVSLFMLSMTDYAASSALLIAAFGNSTLIQIFFIMIFSAAVTNRRVTDYIAYWIMRRKIIEGRPFLFTLGILLGVFVIAVFVSAIAVVLIFWPILRSVFHAIGFEKDEYYPKLMMSAVVIVALLGFPVAPYMQNGLALLTNFRGLMEGFPTLTALDGWNVNDGAYFIFCFTSGILLVVVTTLMIHFVFRPDITKVKSFTTKVLDENPLPPINTAQKWLLGGIAFFIFFMLVPSLFQDAPILSFLYENNVAIMVAEVAVLTMLRTPQGHPIECGQVMKDPDFPWGTFFIVLQAICIGSVLTNDATGVIAFLNTILSPLISGMSPYIFTIFILAVAYVLTNICNSLVIGILLQPIILTYCAIVEIVPGPMISLLIFTVLLSAACTPAASPFAAMLFGNPDLSSGFNYKHSIIFTLVNLVVIMVICIPYANLLI